MKRFGRFFFLLGILFSLFACTDSSPAEATQEVDQTAAPRSGGAGAYFDLREIGLGPNSFVALTNFTDVSASLGGLFLCQNSDCFELPDVTVAPESTVRIAAGDGSGLENVVATGATFGELRPSDGEIALFASPDTRDPAKILNYLQWGSTPHELTDVAVEAGLWLETGFAPTSPTAVRLYRVEDSGLWLFEEP